MEKVEQLIEGRRAAAERMTEVFESIRGVQPHIVNDGRHVYQFYTVTFDESVDRDSVIAFLDDRGIASKVYWDPPVHESEYYTDPDVELPVTEDVSKRVLSLPIHPELSREETDHITGSVTDALDQQR